MIGVMIPLVEGLSDESHDHAIRQLEGELGYRITPEQFQDCPICERNGFTMDIPVHWIVYKDDDSYWEEHTTILTITNNNKGVPGFYIDLWHGPYFDNVVSTDNSKVQQIADGFMETQLEWCNNYSDDKGLTCENMKFIQAKHTLVGEIDATEIHYSYTLCCDSILYAPGKYKPYAYTYSDIFKIWPDPDKSKLWKMIANIQTWESEYDPWSGVQHPSMSLRDQVIPVIDSIKLTTPIPKSITPEPPKYTFEQSSNDAVEQSSNGGGCLIATAAFDSEMAPQVQLLREIRDNTVLQTQSGTAFMTGFNQFYYSFSPTIADYERENPFFKEAVKVTLTPLLTSLTLLNYVDIDTEEEMLGYGIGIILLNVGMYFVAPAVLIISLKKRLFI